VGEGVTFSIACRPSDGLGVFQDDVVEKVTVSS
jgi:hypothetical protein